MSKPELELKIELKKSVLTVLDALTKKVPDWWPGEFIGNSASEGDVFRLATAQSEHTIRVVHNPEPYRITWLFLESVVYHPDIWDIHEWTGIRIVWEVSESNGKTTLSLKLFGLDPRYETFCLFERFWQLVCYNFKRFMEQNSHSSRPVNILYLCERDQRRSFSYGIKQWLRIVSRL